MFGQAKTIHTISNQRSETTGVNNLNRLHLMVVCYIENSSCPLMTNGWTHGTRLGSLFSLIYA